jgi:hypothetical protein
LEICDKFLTLRELNNLLTKSKAMKRVLLFALMLCSIQLFAQDYSFTVGNKNYKLVKTQKSWVDAAAAAVQDGGYLVEINSQAEQTGIWNAIQNSGISMQYTSVSDGGGVAYIWIGATDKVTEGTWLWDGDNDGQGTNFWTGQGAWGSGGGTALNGAYINWGGTNTGTPNEPDDYGSNQDAGAIGLEPWPAAGAGNVAGEWNDIAITNSLYYIIEYDNVGIGEQAEQNIPELTFYQNDNRSIILKSNRELRSVEVFNVSGKQVYVNNDAGTTNLQISLPVAGVYLIRSRFADAYVRQDKILIR